VAAEAKSTMAAPRRRRSRAMASDIWWELDGAPGRPARCLGIFLLLSCCGW
jgi:hypothetical protein